jgi:hypothetical protein
VARPLRAGPVRVPSPPLRPPALALGPKLAATLPGVAIPAPRPPVLTDRDDRSHHDGHGSRHGGTDGKRPLPAPPVPPGGQGGPGGASGGEAAAAGSPSVGAPSGLVLAPAPAPDLMLLALPEQQPRSTTFHLFLERPG